MVQFDLVIDIKANEATETGFLLTAGDNDLKFLVKVLNDGTFMEPATATIVFVRPDGSTAAGSMTPSNSDATELLYTFTGSELTLPGKNSFVLVLTEDSKTITSGHVNFNVKQRPTYSV